MLCLTLQVPETKKAEFTNSVDFDEVAHDEPPHLDLHCVPSYHHHHRIFDYGNLQVHPQQWATFQVTGLLHAWQISDQISRCLYHEGP